ncbi:MAG: hypothetical protein Q9227_008409 [Pyrenula ochraceoflavens]
MLRDTNDNYNHFVFETIFKDRLNDSTSIVLMLEQIFTSFIRMRRQTVGADAPTEQSRGNFRYYCDNDRIDGTARWQILPDPPPAQRPRDYIPQADRNLRGPQTRTGYRQFWDAANAVMMGSFLGCQENMVHAVTFLPTFRGADESSQTQVTPRAVVTLCDFMFDTDSPTSLEDISSETNLGRKEETMAALRTMPSSIILHEFCHFPPWSLKDIKLGDDRRGSAYSWTDILNIRSPESSITNVNNVVFYAILARLKEGGWRLSRRPNGIRRGALYREVP